MKLFQWMRGKRAQSERKNVQVAHVESFLRYGSNEATPKTYDGLVKHGFLTNIIGYACVRLIARNFAAIPLKIRQGEDFTPLEESEGELAGLLVRPNPVQSLSEFLEWWAHYYQIDGDSFIAGLRPEAMGMIVPPPSPNEGLPFELRLVQPNLVTVKTEDGMPVCYKIGRGDRKKVFEASPIDGHSAILHTRGFNPLDDGTGTSPFIPAFPAVSTFNAAGDFNKNLLRNQARPSGAITVDDELEEKQRDQLREELKQNYSGDKNAGRPMILEGGFDWKEMGLSPKDVEYIEGKHVAAREIALAFQVPPMLLGIPGDNTFANYKEARQAFVEQTVLPLSRRFCGDINHWLAHYTEDRIAPDEDRVPEIAEKRATKLAGLESVTFLSVNEKREAAGYPPLDIPDADMPLVDANKIPLGLTLEEEEAAADQGRADAAQSGG